MATDTHPLLSSMLCIVLFTLVVACAAAAPPPTLVLEGQALENVRDQLEGPAGQAQFGKALQQLRAEADAALTEGPWSVVSKNLLPPSGDKHDYMSVGPYWWPDPKQPDGLPYIRRDGEVNPERSHYDNVGLGKTSRNGLTLALAWYFTRDEDYASHAAELLRAWFIDPATRMNPNLQYGQAIPGRTQGRGIGIIDTVGLMQAVDAALILESSEAWSEQDAKALRMWFSEYLDWLRNSQHGQDERDTKNNHGTWYDAQVACFALYTGQPEIAREVLEAAKSKRIDAQIQPDGQMPQELSRTKSWSYSAMNLRGFMTLAALGERAGVDLWNYRSAQGSSIRQALDWLLPFALRARPWTHEQISKFEPELLAASLRAAALAYREASYEAALAKTMSSDALAQERFQLTHPVSD